MLLLGACGAEEQQDAGYPNAIMLVEPQWLAGELGRTDEARMLDMRNPEAYAAGHIQGAINKRAGAFGELSGPEATGARRAPSTLCCVSCP